MASIQLSGLSTGIDTSAIIEQLMQVERRRLTALQTSVGGYSVRRDAISELSTKVSAFRSALRALSDASQLRSYDATTSDSDLLTATANYNAFEGTHNIQIGQLAKANRWVHSGFQYQSQYVGAGNLILSYNNQEFVVQTAANTTLRDLADLINNDPDNTGVTASILEYDDGTGGRYHLVLSGRESGSDYQISINTSNTEVLTSTQMLVGDDDATLTTKLSELGSNFNTGSTGVHQVLIQGNLHNESTPIVDRYFDVNQYTTIEELLDEIETAFGDTVRATLEDGKIVVTDITSGESYLDVTLSFLPEGDSTATWTPPTFSQTTDGGSITSGGISLVPGDFFETQSAQDAMIKIDGYPGGENWIQRSSNTIDDVISGVTLKLHGVTGTDSSVEVSLTRDTEDLKEKMNAMVEAYNAVVMYIDEQTAYDEKEKKSGILSAEYSLSSIRSVIRSPFNLNVAGFNSNDEFDNPQDIGLKIEADGTLTLDENKFDEAIVDNYLDVLALIGAQKSGSSDSTTVEFYQAGTYTEAGEYDVRVTIDAGVITSAQIKLKDEDWSEARDMTIDGNTLYGSEETGTNGPLHPEYSLVLSVDTSQVGTFDVAVNIRQGFAGNLYEIVDDMLKSKTGRIPIAQDGIQTRINNLDRRIEIEEARLDRVEERLRTQYARLERNMQSIQQQMAGLQMLG